MNYPQDVGPGQLLTSVLFVASLYTIFQLSRCFTGVMASSSSPSHSSEEYLAESIGWRLESTAIAFIVIQTACIISRAFSRVLQKTHFMWQDVFANLSYIFNIVLCIMVISTYHGFFS